MVIIVYLLETVTNLWGTTQEKPIGHTVLQDMGQLMHVEFYGCYVAEKQRKFNINYYNLNSAYSYTNVNYVPLKINIVL